MKKQNIEDEKQDKVVTRYEQKMERRRLQAEQEARSDRRFKLAFAATGIIVVGSIAALFATSAINKNKALNDTYIKVGNHEITQHEYDYYYNTTYNNYLNMYSSILPYMGLDTSKDLAEQPYTETMSWKDAFDEMTVDQLIQTKAIVDDAKAKDFTVDLTDKYGEFTSTISQSASSLGYDEKQYYKASFGTYATKANVEPYVREGLLVEAYYEDLMAKNAPSEEEITSYYEANKNNYDKVSYRSFTFSSDLAPEATEEEVAAAMETLKSDAGAMESRRKAGEDFKELCIAYAGEDEKAAYEGTETDASLTENASYASTSYSYQEWLFDESRAAGDITVIEDASGQSYHVVEFVERTYDETTNDTIRDTLAGEVVNEYITALTESYEVIDVAGKLVYLTIPETVAETVSEETWEAETENVTVDGSEAEVVPSESAGADSTAAPDDGAAEAAAIGTASDAAERSATGNEEAETTAAQ